MGSHHNPMSSNNCESGELGERGAGLKICVSDNVNGLQHHPSAAKSDSFVVDMERFSHLTEKDMNANSRITVSSFSLSFFLIFNLLKNRWLSVVTFLPVLLLNFVF